MTESEYKTENVENRGKQCFCDLKTRNIQENQRFLEYFKVKSIIKNLILLNCSEILTNTSYMQFIYQ